MSEFEIVQGDCRESFRLLGDATVDLVLTDPPYPEVDRDYGRLSEPEWWDLMQCVVGECRRVLKPTGSAVFVLQPNSERVGRMRPWLFDFMGWIAREWNLVQDAWWWNVAAMPTVHTRREIGLLRPSVKACVWAGSPDCYRRQENVLWEPSNDVKIQAVARRARTSVVYQPSGHHKVDARICATHESRGGVTPFNVIPVPNTNSATSGGARGHGAATPPDLCRWWIRYACPDGGVVLDPFCGSGTVGAVALESGRDFVGFEKDAEAARRYLSGIVAAREAAE